MGEGQEAEKSKTRWGKSKSLKNSKKPSQFLLLKLTGIVTNSVIRIQVPNVFDFKAIFVPITPILLVM